MATEEIGFRDLPALVRRAWKLILVLGLLPGILVFVFLRLVAPEVYSGTASLVVHHLPANDRTTGSVEVYKDLLASESVVDEARRRLVAEGVVSDDYALLVGENLTILVDTVPDRFSFLVARQFPDSMAVIRLQAFDTDPQVAAAIANVWAEVFVERSRPMTRSPTAGRESVLSEQLPEIRLQLEGLEVERASVTEEYAGRLSRLIKRFQDRENEISAEWDRRIATAETKAESSAAEYYAETRQLMEAAVGRFAAQAAEEGEPSPGLRPKLLEIVSVRAELAKAPRVLTLEKAASDETLAEMLLDSANADRFDNTLVTQELNPLYEQLAIALLDLEGELKRQAGARLADVSRTLGELEQIQLDRSAGLAALVGENRLEPRSLHRQRSYALRTLARERKDALDEVEAARKTALDEIRRRHDRLVDLEQRMKEELNTAFLAGLFEQVDSVALASRAVPHSVPEPRRAALMAAAVAFLGGMLGLMIALFRSADSRSA